MHSQHWVHVTEPLLPRLHDFVILPTHSAKLHAPGVSGDGGSSGSSGGGDGSSGGGGDMSLGCIFRRCEKMRVPFRNRRDVSGAERYTREAQGIPPQHANGRSRGGRVQHGEVLHAVELSELLV